MIFGSLMIVRSIGLSRTVIVFTAPLTAFGNALTMRGISCQISQ